MVFGARGVMKNEKKQESIRFGSKGSILFKTKYQQSLQSNGWWNTQKLNSLISIWKKKHSMTLKSSNYFHLGSKQNLKKDNTFKKHTKLWHLICKLHKNE